jgi:hypothetical protein
MSVSLYGNGQTIIQVQTTTLTSAFSWTTKGAWTNITGLSVSITPQSTTSKILVLLNLTDGGGGNNYERVYQITRNGTAIGLGPTFSNQMVQACFQTGIGSLATNAVCNTGIWQFVDSPSTTSSTTYQLQGWASSSSVTTSYINQPYVPNTSFSSGGSSTITVMEISYA